MENELSGVVLKGSLRRSDRVRRLGLQGCDARLRDEVQEKTKGFYATRLEALFGQACKSQDVQKEVSQRKEQYP